MTKLSGKIRAGRVLISMKVLAFLGVITLTCGLTIGISGASALVVKGGGREIGRIVTKRHDAIKDQVKFESISF